MDRRGFLQNAMIAAAALVVDPERLLWEPGKKTIFIPKADEFAELTLHYYSRTSGSNTVNWQWTNEAKLNVVRTLFPDARLVKMYIR